MLLAAFCAAISCCAQAAPAKPAPTPLPHQPGDNFQCQAGACVLPAYGSYPYLVIGVFHSAATAEQSQHLFSQMRTQHFWQDLPADPAAFSRAIQPVSIQLVDNSALSVLMSQEEAAVMLPQPGDLVRYSPHFGEHELPPTDPVERSLWAIDGCVAVICRAEDKPCFAEFRRGVYRRQDGKAISPTTFQVLPEGGVIDVQSLRPIQDSRSAL
jgi:hypothetical protein